MRDIVLSHLTKSFGARSVFSDLSLTLSAGSVTCLTGASGCGKTTLLKIIAGLLVPDSGTVSGADGRISFVFQEDRLCEAFSARSNIRLVAALPDNEIVSHIAALGLAEDTGKPVREFSGGMKRRVAIARAICCPSELLLLDEPFDGLDAASCSLTMDYIKANRRGRTMVYVTHDLKEAAYMGGRIINLDTF